MFLSVIVLLAILTIIIALPVTFTAIGTVNAQNINQEKVDSQGPIEDKIIGLEGSFKELLIITPKAEGSNNEENSDECENESNCFNGNLNENTENRESESSVDILLPFP